MSMTIFCAAPHIALPSEKRVRLPMRTAFRPKTSRIYIIYVFIFSPLNVSSPVQEHQLKAWRKQQQDCRKLQPRQNPCHEGRSLWSAKRLKQWSDRRKPGHSSKWGSRYDVPLPARQGKKLHLCREWRARIMHLFSLDLQVLPSLLAQTQLGGLSLPVQSTSEIRCTNFRERTAK